MMIHLQVRFGARCVLKARHRRQQGLGRQGSVSNVQGCSDIGLSAARSRMTAIVQVSRTPLVALVCCAFGCLASEKQRSTKSHRIERGSCGLPYGDSRYGPAYGFDRDMPGRSFSCGGSVALRLIHACVMPDRWLSSDATSVRVKHGAASVRPKSFSSEIDSVFRGLIGSLHFMRLLSTPRVGLWADIPGERSR